MFYEVFLNKLMIFCTLDTITSYCRFHLELFQHSFVLIAGHISNQYDTCLWMLVKSGKTLSETQEILKVCCLSTLTRIFDLDIWSFTFTWFHTL